MGKITCIGSRTKDQIAQWDTGNQKTGVIFKSQATRGYTIKSMGAERYAWAMGLRQLNWGTHVQTGDKTKVNRHQFHATRQCYGTIKTDKLHTRLRYATRLGKIARTARQTYKLTNGKWQAANVRTHAQVRKLQGGECPRPNWGTTWVRGKAMCLLRYWVTSGTHRNEVLHPYLLYISLLERESSRQQLRLSTLQEAYSVTQ